MTEKPVVLVTAGDNNFAMPLAVALSSALRHLDRRRDILVYVLDDGIEPALKQRCVQIAKTAHPKVTLQWVSPDMHVFAGLHGSPWNTRATYLRLLIPRIVPEPFDRIVYFDSDVVVQRDLSELWNVPFEDKVVFAVQEMWRSERSDEPTIGNHLPHLIDEIDAPADALYCNAGVLLISASRWRAEKISERVLDFLRMHGNKAMFADQDGLNVIFAGQWGRLDPVWNIQILTLDAFGSRHASQRDRKRQQRDLLKNAGIIHFTGKRKPWHWRYRGRARGAFYRAYIQSGWTGPVSSLAYVATRLLSHSLYGGLASARQALKSRKPRSTRPA
jgi:lipopolysaccharide biosynthesis glycosyltransferase